MRQPAKRVPSARPFLKWAGGKNQLLDAFGKRLPEELPAGKISRYVEPFIGGGAVFFHLIQRFSFEHSGLCDINEELVLTYRVLQRSVPKLVAELSTLQSEYCSLGEPEREKYYYAIHDALNQGIRTFDRKRYHSAWIERAAMIIFLNRTRYNGLFRVNQDGEFNVPFGRYSDPEILNEPNLTDVARV